MDGGAELLDQVATMSGIRGVDGLWSGRIGVGLVGQRGGFGITPDAVSRRVAP